MLNFIIIVLLNGVAVWLAAKLLKGVTVSSVAVAIWVGILISILNGTIGWIFRILTFPLNWLTLGLISFLITVVIILLVDKLVRGFQIKNFFWAVLFAILVAIFNAILQTVFFVG